MQKFIVFFEQKATTILSFMLVAGFVIASGSFTSSMAAPDGKTMYKKKCAMCHKDGGNSANPKKPVKGSKFIKDKKTFKDYLSKKHGVMPAFPKIAGNDAALTALHKYVKGLK